MLSYRISLLVIAVLFMVLCQAQTNGYTSKDGCVYYCDEAIEHADVNTFRVLKYGYAKDKNNVYYKGDILRFVDPVSFKLKGKKDNATDELPETGYYKADGVVFYNGKTVKGVFTVSNFKDLGDGYAIDTFNAYYKGVKIEGAHASGFKNLGKGYAKDSFHTYFYGKKTE